MKIILIGGGNMGLAIARALIDNKKLKVKELNICEKNKKKWKFFESMGKTTLSNILEKKKIESADIIIIAIKPQDITQLSKVLKQAIKNQIIISIAAGITLKNLEKILNSKKIIRVMPNTPALIGEAISGWIAGKDIKTQDKKIIKKILCSFGEEIEFKSEDKIDLVTALSGSGPAYFFYFIQNLIEGAVELGMDKKSSEKLAMQTAIGSIKLALSSKDDLKTLREKVTSKGGTTEAAIKVFKQGKMDKLIKKAMKEAYKRAKKLADHIK